MTVPGLIVALVVVALVWSASPRSAVEAQSVDNAGGGNGPDWTDTPLTSAVTRLFTPSGGALLAVTSDELMRSDDAGDSWYQVVTPRRVVYVDPTSQDTLYATSDSDPLLRSADGGMTWTSLLGGSTYAGKVLDKVAASPADPNVLYAGLKRPSISAEYWFYGTSDAGVTWTQLLCS